MEDLLPPKPLPKPLILDPAHWDAATKAEREAVLRMALRGAFVRAGWQVADWLAETPGGRRFMELQHGASATLARVRARWIAAEHVQALAEDKSRGRRELDEIRARHTAAVLPMRKKEA
jgi:hypothetical protein